MSEYWWYLSGQMSGIEAFNFPRFDYAASLLRAMGFLIINPTEEDNEGSRAEALASQDGNPRDVSMSWGQFLGRDIQIIADKCHGVILLDDWYLGAGSKLEAYAAYLRDKRFMTFNPVDYRSKPIYISALDVMSLINEWS